MVPTDREMARQMLHLDRNVSWAEIPHGCIGNPWANDNPIEDGLPSKVRSEGGSAVCHVEAIALAGWAYVLSL